MRCGAPANVSCEAGRPGPMTSPAVDPVPRSHLFNTSGFFVSLSGQSTLVALEPGPTRTDFGAER